MHRKSQSLLSEIKFQLKFTSLFNKSLLIMGSKVHCHTPKSNLYPDHILLTVKPLPKRTQIPLRRKNKSPNQILKERFNIMHQISLKSTHKDPFLPIQASEIQKLTANLKRLKHLTCIEIDLNSLPLNHKFILRFFESLKHFKQISKINFFTSQPSISFSNQSLLALSQCISGIHPSPHLEIKLSLNISVLDSDQNFCKLLGSFAKHPCFMKIHLTFSNFHDLSKAQAIISNLKNSKSLSHFNLTLGGCNLSVEQSGDLFRSLKHLKSVKNLNIHFKHCLLGTPPFFKGLAFALKENTQVQDLEIVFERKVPLINKFEWWSFVRSLKKNTHFRTVKAKFIGQLQFLTHKAIILFFVLMACVFVVANVLPYFT